VITNGFRLSIARHPGPHLTVSNSPNKLLKTALWMIWVPIVAVFWVMLLDTSYDWISSPSTAKVIAGFMILILMACAVLGLVIKGARKLWTR
jgi:hypothetical protein